MSISNRKFGVEIEFVGISPEDAVRALREARIECHHEEYNHSTRTYWKVVRDSSVRPGRGIPANFCGELVSPPLKGEQGLQELKRAVNALKAAGASANASCGLHVHVDARDLTGGEILGVVHRYAHFESEIDGFMPAHRNRNRFARTVSGSFVEQISRRMNSDRNAQETFRHVDRYRKVNVASYARHNTVEFRQHQGTVEYSKIENWVQFCVAFVQRFVDARSTTATPRVRRIRPNYRARASVMDGLCRRNGVTLEELSRISGFALNRLKLSGKIFRDISQFATVACVEDRFRVTSIVNYRLYDEWLGVLDVPRRAGRLNESYIVPAIAASDTLFDGVPESVATFYRNLASRTRRRVRNASAATSNSQITVSF